MRLPKLSHPVNRVQVSNIKKGIYPSLYDLYKVLPIPNLKKYAIDLQPSCDIACGEERYDCHRTGGDDCELKFDQCLIEKCFFSIGR